MAKPLAIILSYGSTVDNGAVIGRIKKMIRTGDKSQIQLQTAALYVPCQSFSQGGDWFHLIFPGNACEYHYDAFSGWSTKSLNEDDGGSIIVPPAEEPFVEYSAAGENPLAVARLYGFTVIPQRLFYNAGITAVDFKHSPNLVRITHDAFTNCSNLDNVEITAREVDYSAFTNSSALKKVWIRSSCETIIAGTSSLSPFSGCSTALKIYVEADSKPDGWDTYFNRTGYQGNSYAQVTYGQTTSPF